MSASIIVKFTAAEGKAKLLTKMLTRIQGGAIAAGCQRITLCQSDENPNEFIEYEEWESIDAYQTFMAALPMQATAALSTLLAGPVEKTYYNRLQTTEK